VTPAQFQACLALLAVVALCVTLLGAQHVLSPEVAGHMLTAVIAGTLGALSLPKGPTDSNGAPPGREKG
jgi:hypothetical protein